MGYFPLSDIRVEAGQIVGFSSSEEFAQSLYLYSGTYYTNPTTAGGNLFGLSFTTTVTTTGPQLRCVNCRTFFNPGDGSGGDGAGDVFASTANLTQFLVTYTDNAGTVPKFTDPITGKALGAVLDSNGVYLGQSVPEPGTLALALAGLTAVGWSRRRRRRDA